MTTGADSATPPREPQLRGQTVVVIGGSSGRYAAGKVRPGGTLLFMGATVGRSGVGVGIIMSNTALTGAAYDIDGGQQLVPAAGG